MAPRKMLLYSGHEEENALNAQVVLVLSKERREALTGWKTYGSRIIEASLKQRSKGLQ